jgi:Asp-tRNA(Asn)/Glu-tRNA(Gln) amidotransferase A subunit family amidase
VQSAAPAGGASGAPGVCEIRERCAAGTLTALAVSEACLARVDAVDAQVRAWAYLDREAVLVQARALDARRGRGPLQGVPVGVKDIIDTADMPTENGTVLHAGRRPARDAAVVARLRAAGAVIFGKTVTTELATYAPGKTRNPHDPAHTPGGSSSGSAAAVAAGMVPAAIGTQTNGSVIRPAAFCGVVGYKPGFGLIPRAGILRQSPTLDQVGVFARSVEDAAELAAALCEGETAAALRVAARDPAASRLAWMRTAAWPQAEAATQAAFEGLARRLGLAELAMPEAAAPTWDWQRTVMEAEIAENYAEEWARGRDRLSATLRAQIERGLALPAAAVAAARARIAAVNAAFDPLFERCDALVTPAVPGPAPRGLDSTGDPVFCTLWTFAGLPALTLPLLAGANGLPLGVQLVARRGNDAGLIRAAVALWRVLR